MSEETEVTELGPGASLKVIREQQGLSVTEVAERLKLMEQSIRNIEMDDYKDIPITFYKGYIKNYAQLLELDADKASASFAEYVNKHGLGGGASFVNTNYANERIKKKSKIINPRLFMKAISFLLILAVVYSIYYLLFEKGYWNSFMDSFNKEEASQELPLESDENEGELIPDTNNQILIEKASLTIYRHNQ